jgi:ABC-type polysaccharide/polyol phosphate export permease
MAFGNIMDNRFIQNFMKYRYLLYELVKKSVKLEYRRSFLGVFWIFLSPLLYTIVLTIVFSTFLGKSVENYPVYLLCGRLAFDFFSGGSKAALNSLRKATIIKRIYVPKYIYPLASVLGKYVTFIMSLIILALLVIVTGVILTWHIFFVIIPFVLLFFMTLGVGLTLATIVMFFRDVQHLWGVFTTLLMWCSALFYPVSVVPEKYHFIFQYNPLFQVIDMIRKSVIYGQAYDSFQVLYVLGVTIFFLTIGIILLYKYQDKFILYI